MAISQLYIPYPDFKLMEVIDPEEHDANNAEITNRINAMITILNSFINGEANDSLSAMAVHMPAVEPFAESNVEQFFRDLIGALRSTLDGVSGADFVHATPVEGLEGETVQAQVESLKNMLDSIITESGDTSLGLGLHKSSGDHDSRYHTKEEIATKDKAFLDLLDFKLDKTGDLEGTFGGYTIEKLLSAAGTGFGTIEVLKADPVEPDVGRIWILETDVDAQEPEEEGEEEGGGA